MKAWQSFVAGISEPSILLVSALIGSALNSAAALPNELGDPSPRSSRESLIVPSGMRSQRIALAGNLVYVADGDTGLAVYDISVPAKPRRTAIYPTEAAAMAVQLTGGNVWVTTVAGTVVLDATDPTNPQPLRSVGTVEDGIEISHRNPRLVDIKIPHPTSYNETAPQTGGAIVAVVGDRAYISRDNGVVELELHGMGLPAIPKMAHLDFADFNSTAVLSAKPAQPGPVKVAKVNAAPPGQVEVPFNGAAVTGFLFVDASRSAQTISSTEPLGLAGVFESGAFCLWVSGPAGQMVRVQRSSALVGDWKDWQTITLGDAPIELTDEDGAGVDQTFYRAVTP
jgi:LVIVD repeat